MAFQAYPKSEIAEMLMRICFLRDMMRTMCCSLFWVSWMLCLICTFYSMMSYTWMSSRAYTTFWILAPALFDFL